MRGSRAQNLLAACEGREHRVDLGEQRRLECGPAEALQHAALEPLAQLTECVQRRVRRLRELAHLARARARARARGTNQELGFGAWVSARVS